MTDRHHRLHAFAAVALFLAFATATFAADATRNVERSFPGGAGRSIEVKNLAGNALVTASADDQIHLAATVHASAATSGEAERLADRLQIAVRDGGAKVAVKAEYPLAQYRKYSYPRRGAGHDLPWFLEWLDVGGVSSKYDGVSVRVVSEPSSSAPTLFVDFEIRVPAGVAVTVDGFVGEYRAAGVDGAVTLDLGSGWVESRDGRGQLILDTGSGDVLVVGHAGEVSADTGSGDVRIERVTGERVSVDTGSGDVHLVEIRASLAVDTGSGDVIAERFAAGEQLNVDTGSGDVRISGDLSGVTRLDIDTGSGDVLLTSSRVPDLRLAVSTGSGDITVDLPATRILSRDRNDLSADLGAGTGAGAISTGSGDVELRSAR